MKHKKILSILLAAAAAISLTGCNNGGGTSSGESSVPEEDVNTPVVEALPAGVSENGWKFSQVAMGGGGFVSGVFATSEEGLYYARTDVGGE